MLEDGHDNSALCLNKASPRNRFQVKRLGFNMKKALHLRTHKSNLF